MLDSKRLNRFDNILYQRNPAAKNRSNGKDAHQVPPNLFPLTEESQAFVCRTQVFSFTDDAPPCSTYFYSGINIWQRRFVHGDGW